MDQPLPTIDPAPPLRDPRTRVRRWSALAWRALCRNWGRDVMLYTGGVSFYALLAVFPALSILISLYAVLSDAQDAAALASAFAELMPARGFVSFNVLAVFAALAAFALLVVTSTAFFTFRVIASAFEVELPLLFSEWLWASIGLTGGLTLLYRYGMSRARTPWKPSLLGGAAGAVLSLFASWICAIYVESIAPLGATYGSVGAVVIFLIWLSWNVNAVFVGGALATEIEHAMVEPELL
jgi:membrane protein